MHLQGKAIENQAVATQNSPPGISSQIKFPGIVWNCQKASYIYSVLGM